MGLGLNGQAMAATIVWGNTATAFGTNANWIGGTAPANNLTGDIGSFQAATVSFNPQLTASRSINGLEFTSGTGAWTFSGNSGTRVLTLGASGILSNDDSTQTFNQANLGIALGANAAFTSNSTGALSFGSTLASFALSTFTLTLNGTSTNTANAIAEPISGTGGITKDGTGTWLLSGANTYTGKTIINNGVLAITAETGLGANPGASVADQLTLNGGTLRTQTAAVTINDANREISIGAGGGTFDTVTDLTIASTNIISGSGALNKTGAGNLTLQSVSSYSGNLTVSSGTVTYGVSNALSTGGVTVSGGTLAMGTFSDTVGAVSLTSGSITGSTGVLTGTSYDMQSGSVTAILGGAGVALTKTTAGTVTLSGANTYTGLTTVNAGTLAYGASNVLSTGAVTVDGGTAVLDLGLNQSDSVGTVTLANGGSITGSGTSTLTSTGSFEMQSGSVTAILAGNVALNKTTTGTVTLSGTSANTYTGTTSVSDGTLNLNKTAGNNAVGTGAITVGDGVGASSSANIVLLASNQIADTAAVTLNSDGRLSTGNFTESIGTIAGTGLIDLSTSGYLTVGANNASSTFGGSITGTGTLEKAGTGTLTFNNTINYAGSLLLSGGTLQLNGIGVTVDTLTLTGNSTIDFAGTNATLNVTNLNLNGFTLNITNWANAADYFYATNWAGATLDTRGTGSETQVVFNSPTYSGSNTSWQSYDHQITPVPEPSTYGVMLLGSMCALVGGYRRWQQSLVAVKA
ncbi:MAG: autotransporter-associated beta strand repeat-containing protein [Opitutae bacterium]